MSKARGGPSPAAGDDDAVRASRRRPGRRVELLAAALEVVRRVGPDASMHEMAAEAGITKPVLYRYFGDRDGLIASMAEQFSDELIERLRQAVATVPDRAPVSMIRAAIESYVSFIEEDPALYGFLTHRVPIESPTFVGVVDRIAGWIAETIEEVLRANALDPRPAATWAHGLVGMVHLAGARWVRVRDVARRRLVDDLVRLAAFGLTGAAVSEPPPGS